MTIDRELRTVGFAVLDVVVKKMKIAAPVDSDAVANAKPASRQFVRPLNPVIELILLRSE